MNTTTSSTIPDSTYFRTGDAEPTISDDGTITLYDGRGSRRGWGAPQVNTTVIVDTEDFLAVLVGFSHKHGGSQFYRYYVQTPTGPARRTWAQLTDDERSLILAAYEDKAPAWANRPGKLSTERAKPAASAFIGYKLMRQTAGGALISFYDLTTWELSKLRTEAATENHGGGYYVHTDPAQMRELHAAGKLVPVARRDDFEWTPTLVKCECRGRTVTYSSGKIAVTYCKPVEIVETW